MQRDKRGRFVKKAQLGTQVNGESILTTSQGKKYKLKPGVTMENIQSILQGSANNAEAYDAYIMQYGDPVEDNTSTETPVKTPLTTQTTSITTPITLPSLKTSQYSLNNPLSRSTLNMETRGNVFDNFTTGEENTRKLALQSGLTVTTGPFARKRIKVAKNDKGEFVTEYGTTISPLELDPNIYDTSFFTGMSGATSIGTTTNTEEQKDKGEKSKGMHLVGDADPLKQYKNKEKSIINKNKLANFLELTRAGIGASVNDKIAERALEAEKPFLQDISESHRSVYGDYRAQIQGEKAAAQLRNMASKPLTSDGALQQQMMLDAQIKGQQYIDQGNAQDEALIKQTRETAWQQEKENQQQRQAVAMQNRQAVLMSEKNKANIRNVRDSATFSQVISPLLAAKEQRWRNEGVKQKYYQDYYNDALVTSDVWNTYEDGLTSQQKLLKAEYNKGGIEGVQAYIKAGKATEADFTQLQRIMNSEVVRRRALLKGAYINPDVLNTVSGTQNSFASGSLDWETKPFGFKKGGSVYKAKLNKRTKDNDRAAKSIESSKKIAARLLEKAIDQIYSYNDVEIVAKPKKKRKYQAGGGLPFVGFTPIFATSEEGASKEASKKGEDSDDLTTKDVLSLLKDMDGLPSDMQLIVASLKNFQLQDKMDPLGLSSSSDIASRYISLINKIKVAKFNREEYNNAFNQLKGNGGLNEYAITSEGYLIGSNKEGDFQMFTPDEVNAGEPRLQGYSLLTNSNLLYLRANSTDAAFNHQLTTFAQGGIGMEVITEQINKIVQSLGSSKEGEEGFVQMGSKGQIKQGIKFLQKAAKEVGDDTINENMSVADYYQSGYLTEDQAEQAQLALQYIWSALPTNAKSLLQVKGGSAKGAEAIVKSLLYSKTSSDIQFKASPKKMSASSTSSSGSTDDVDKLKLTPVQMMQVGYTDHQQVTLQKGTKYATIVNAQVLPITDVNKKLLGVTTLDRVAESTFGGALDMNNVTMGSQLIDPQALQNVQIDSTNLYVMNLPIDKNSPDGTIKPDLAWMNKIEEIDQVIRDQNITDIAQINKLYTDAGLPVLMDDNGQLNLRDYCKFGVLNGHALNSAFKDLDLLDNTVLEIDDEDQVNNVLSILNKGRNEKDRIDFDSKSWADSIFGTDHDSLYEGTIYIPVRTNAFAGMIGGGEYPTTSVAEEVEALIQQKERTRGYVDPGLLM